MAYSLNGVSFDNSTWGWKLRSVSDPLADLKNDLSSIPRLGRHGALSPTPGTLEVPALLLVVRTPRVNRRALLGIARKGGVLTNTYDPGEMVVELASASSKGMGGADGTVDVHLTFRVPSGSARGAEATSAAVSLTTASVAVPNLLAGSTLDVQDAIVRLKGAVTGLQVTDSAGSWFTYGGSILGTEWLRFEANTGRAFKTTTDVWVGGTEVSGAIDFGGPRGIFEITPAGADPTAQAGALTVATGTRTGASIQVRGRPAYLI